MPEEIRKAVQKDGLFLCRCALRRAGALHLRTLLALIRCFATSKRLWRRATLGCVPHPNRSMPFAGGGLFLLGQKIDEKSPFTSLAARKIGGKNPMHSGRLPSVGSDTRCRPMRFCAIRLHPCPVMGAAAPRARLLSRRSRAGESHGCKELGMRCCLLSRKDLLCGTVRGNESRCWVARLPKALHKMGKRKLVMTVLSSACLFEMVPIHKRSPTIDTGP